jgi:hypothetical protein
MDKELKAKWIAALRSGVYHQTRGSMKDFDGYCCLGVLREIIAPGSTAAAKNSDHLSAEHAEIAGLRFGQQSELANMNDGSNDHRPHSFAEIADYIEKEIPCS